MGEAFIYSGDAVKWSEGYKGDPFHALFCDAPYEMGFMGASWDQSGVAFDPNTWRSFSRSLFPGAFLFVFAGTINDDLISLAMREAGLRKHHKMMGWVTGEGFPKGSKIEGSKKEAFSGHKYGLQVLKPAIETILIFQKPYDGSPLEDISQTGAGALNIEGAKIPPGRWPSNFYLDEGAAYALDKQSGSGKSGKHGTAPGGFNPRGTALYSKGSMVFDASGGFDDEGGVSRFFFNSHAQIDEADPAVYRAKASTRERESGLIDRLPCLKCEILDSEFHKDEEGEDERCRRNSHTTVKPLSLCKYLAGLLLPPIDFAPRRLLVPFSGVASEMIGALQAGWEEIQGIELTEKYIPIAEARIEYYSAKPIQESLF